MTPPTAPKATRFGEFELLAPLSRGGMGEVYLARQHGAQGFRRFVALKLMRLDLETDHNTRQLFFDEAQLLARITHPAVAQVFGFGEEAGNLYLAMEYVAGVSFAVLRQLPPGALPPEVAASLVAAAARGLHAAHELKDLDGRLLDVVHRDVSPQNLMVTFEGQVKVLDFGIALHRERTSQATSLGSVRGKAAYIAPEVLLGEAPTRQCDVWALGVVLHELLSGRPLFKRDQDLASMHAVLNGEIPPPGQDVAPALSQVTMKALARPLGERFPSAAALADALEGVVRDQQSSGEAWARHALADRRGAQERWLAENSRAAPRPEPGVALATPQRPGSMDVPTKSVQLQPLAHSGRRWPLAVLLLVLVVLGSWGGGRLLTSQPALVAEAVDSGVVTVTVPDSGGALAPEQGSPPPTVAEVPDTPVDAGRPRVRPTKKAPLASSVVAPAVAPPQPAPPVPLTVFAVPYGLVRVDGKLIGPTPVYGSLVEVGRHRVELTAPDTGEVRALRDVTLVPGVPHTVDFR
ncbi:MAG: serine/threonine-protein kinase [Archangium sp.]|nr:serine/threonine-protein kinase [Archangium sp.]